MQTHPYADLPQDLTFHKEWQRIVFMPNGERVANLDSGWYDEETIARSLLNSEYPDPTPTGWYMRLQVRYVSERRDADRPTPVISQELMFEHLGEDVNVILHDGTSLWRRLIAVSKGQIMLSSGQDPTNRYPKRVDVTEIRSFGTKEHGLLEEVK